MKYDICCIGHITLDKVVTTSGSVCMPGGTAFYFSNAIANMNTRYKLITSLAHNELTAVAQLRDMRVDVNVIPAAYTLFFENIYGENQDHRTQRVLQQAAPFSMRSLPDVDAEIFHLGPLLAGDMSSEMIIALAEKGEISLDVQGLLRKVENKDVCPVDWSEKKELLPYVHYLKANEDEMAVLTGTSDVYESARIFAGWGVEEVIITLGSMGSVIYRDQVFTSIPAFLPLYIKDATGCGDTYMAGYLSNRITGASIDEAGVFAAAMATLKIETSGPFTGTSKEVFDLLESNKRLINIA